MREREKEIDSILKMDLREPPPGRKSEPAYDRALYAKRLHGSLKGRFPFLSLRRKCLPKTRVPGRGRSTS